METLHIYAQEMWYDESYIAGTPEALKLLRDAIDAAIENGSSKAGYFVCDGEGYTVEGYTVEVVAATDEQMAKMAVPYTDDCAKGDAESMKFGPWTLLRPNKK